MDAMLQSDPPQSNFYDETAKTFQTVLDAVNRLKARIVALEAQVSEISKQKYLGVYKPGAMYSEGSEVTYDGSRFYAHKATKETPGSGCPDWQLSVKRGRDGKDADRDLIRQLVEAEFAKLLASKDAGK